MSDFEPCLNQLQLDLITLLVNVSYQVGTMMSRYDFLEARRVILRNVRTDYLKKLEITFDQLDLNWGQ